MFPLSFRWIISEKAIILDFFFSIMNDKQEKYIAIQLLLCFPSYFPSRIRQQNLLINSITNIYLNLPETILSCISAKEVEDAFHRKNKQNMQIFHIKTSKKLINISIFCYLKHAETRAAFSAVLSVRQYYLLNTR